MADLSPQNAGSSSSQASRQSFTNYQIFVVMLLAFLQFTIILDFMILSPLGALLMPALNITPQQFGIVVSAYAFSAGLSGLLASGFADGFDRKKFLLFFYVGFVAGTFLCAVANSYEFLLVARIVTGLFGGVVGSAVFAITTDLFPMSMRGRVMGAIQTAFAGSQVLGIPLGLYFSAKWGWHAPFFLIVVVSVLVGILMLFRLEPIAEHLKLPREKSPFRHLKQTISEKRYQQAFATMALLSTGGFMLMPFGSAFSVHNLGIDLEQLPLVYMITGVCAIVLGPLIGRASDRFGSFKLFLYGSILMVIMVLIYTHLGVTPLETVIAINVIMFVGISSRMITSQALMSAIPAPSSRGSFMSVGSSIQQVSGGIAAVLAGMIVVEGKDGVLEHFDWLGYVVVAATIISILMMQRINKIVGESAKQSA